MCTYNAITFLLLCLVHVEIQLPFKFYLFVHPHLLFRLLYLCQTHHIRLCLLCIFIKYVLCDEKCTKKNINFSISQFYIKLRNRCIHFSLSLYVSRNPTIHTMRGGRILYTDVWCPELCRYWTCLQRKYIQLKIWGSIKDALNWL